VAAQLYLQLARDGNPPRGESAFYFTFTGPAIYTDAKKFEKIDFADIEKGKSTHASSASDGWVAMVQHYFASAWLVPDGTPREFRTAKVSNNLYSVAMVLPLGEIAAGATKSHDATLFAGPQEENKLAAMAPGLDLVRTTAGSRYWPSRCSGCSTSSTRSCTTGAGRSWPWWCC
jgi:membrane protein insertase, YidC/Oxa1 family, N-terminal domain